MKTLITLFITTLLFACTTEKTTNLDLFLNPEHVNIQGEEGEIQIINSSSDCKSSKSLD